jgi:hypothetical protein
VREKYFLDNDCAMAEKKSADFFSAIAQSSSKKYFSFFAV